MRGRSTPPALVALRDKARHLLLGNGWTAKEVTRVIFYREPHGMPQRDARMAEMYAAGRTLAEIGVEFNLTRERVRQLLVKQGVSSIGGGASSRRRSASIKKAESRINSLNLRAMTSYGCDYETARALNDGQQFSAQRSKSVCFQEQRKNAKERGIGWSLSFVEWCAAWKDSGKWSVRGRGKNGYCMARLSDSGAYAAGNVKICSNVENISESFQFNPSSARQKLNLEMQGRISRRAEMLDMRLAGKTIKEIAEHFDVAPSSVRRCLSNARRIQRETAEQGVTP